MKHKLNRIIAFLFIIVLLFTGSVVNAEEYYTDEYREKLLELYDCLDRQITEYENTEETRVKLDVGEVKVSSRGYDVADAVSWSDARKIVAMLCGEHPRFLTTVNNLGFYYDKQAPELVTALNVKRLDIDVTYKEMYNRLDAETDKIIAEVIKDGMSDLDKAFAVYMYLITECTGQSTAGSDNREPDTVYGILINKTGSCGGFANTYKWLMDKLNIPCEICDSRSKGHLWNYIKIDGCWFHVDASVGNNSQSAKFFLNNDEERKSQLINSDKIVYDWASIHKDVVCDPNHSNCDFLFSTLGIRILKTMKYDNGYSFLIDGNMFYFPTLYNMSDLVSIPVSNITGELADVAGMKSAHSVVYGNQRTFTAYIAGYNSNDNITNIEKRNLTFNSSNREIDLSVDFAENADHIKIFFWTENMMPVANVTEVK